MDTYLLRRELMSLLMSKENKKNLFKFDRFRYIYFLNIEDALERENLYRFFKALEIDIKENSKENHLMMSLIDIWIDIFNGPLVSYELWHILQSNMLRKALSHSYEEFLEIINKSYKLKELFRNVEKEKY